MSEFEAKIQELVEEFAGHVVKQSESILKSDAKTGNRHARQLNSVFDKLCTHGNAGRDALTVLFTHPRMDVRVKAAAFLLRHRTEEAKAVLRQAAEGSGRAAFGASEALKRWEEGTWALDPG